MRTLLARLGVVVIAWLLLCSPPVLGLLGDVAPGLFNVPGVGVVTDAGASVWAALNDAVASGGTP
jgi:hypothetical protein